MPRELDDIDEDEHDVGPVVFHRLSRWRSASISRSSGKSRPIEDPLEIVLGIEKLLPVLVDEALKDGFLGTEVVVEIAHREPARFRNRPHRGGAVALG